jgi:hypothetical protein
MDTLTPLVHSTQASVFLPCTTLVLCSWCEIRTTRYFVTGVFWGLKRRGEKELGRRKGKGRGAKISDHVLRVPCEFGVRLGIVGGGGASGI